MKTLKISLAIVILVGLFGSGCIENPFAPDPKDIYANSDGICGFIIEQIEFQYNWNSGEMVITNRSSKRTGGVVVLWDKHWEEREGYRFWLDLNRPCSYIDHYTNGDSFVLKINFSRDGVDYENYIELHR